MQSLLDCSCWISVKKDGCQSRKVGLTSRAGLDSRRMVPFVVAPRGQEVASRIFDNTAQLVCYVGFRGQLLQLFRLLLCVGGFRSRRHQANKVTHMLRRFLIQVLV